MKQYIDLMKHILEHGQERNERILKELAEFWPDAYFDLGMKGLI